jgi:F-type H+-transporting ATPase subunit gamma
MYSGHFVETFDMSAHKTLTLAAVEPVSQLIMTLFREGKADVVTLYYSRFKSVVSQIPTAKGLVPAEVEAGAQAADLGGAAYDYEPDEDEILATLLPRNITVQILSALLENQAGFYASQMAAMDNATRNAGDMINRLTIVMNRTRQAKITTELIEIISGASAL